MNHVTKPLPLDPTVAAERLVFGARAEAGRWMIAWRIDAQRYTGVR